MQRNASPAFQKKSVKAVSFFIFVGLDWISKRGLLSADPVFDLLFEKFVKLFADLFFCYIFAKQTMSDGISLEGRSMLKGIKPH